jgi:hypothetical protein
MSRMSWEEQFLHPSEEYTPIPFWFWNDNLTEEELRRQIHDFAEKGVMGFVIHPRIGIPESIPYLSDTYMNLVRFAVKEAASLGMKVILYDEAMYPSGAAKGLVVQGNPEYASRGLKMVEKSGAERLVLSDALGEGDVLVSVQAVKKSTEGSIDPADSVLLYPVEDTVSLEQLEGEAPEWTILLFIETFSKGTIRGIHFGEDDGEPNVPASADLLNPAATAKFIRLTHERYYEWLQDEFGTTVIAMFTDEPEIMGRRHIKGLKSWTKDFLADFIAEGNKEQELPLLWFDSTNGSASAVRAKYRKAVQKRMTASYYKPLSEWCEKHGIALTGHPAASDDIGLLELFQIPGQDVVWRWVAPENNLGLEGRHSTAAKCASDAARHRGRRRNLNEVLGVCGKNNDWNLSAGDMKWYLDWLFVRGCNLISPHAFYYSVDGPRRFNERPPDVGPNNIWWPHYKTIAQYIKRMSWLMTDSRNQASIAVVCKEDSLPWRMVKPLYENQWEFNYLEEKLLTTAGIVLDGSIRIAGYEYTMVLIEEGDELEPETVRVLNKFKGQGGAIICLAAEDVAKGQVDATAVVSDVNGLVSAIEPYAAPTVRLIPGHADIRVTHVIKENQHFIVAVNEGEVSYQGSLETVVTGYTELWDAWAGTVRPVHPLPSEAGQRVQLDLERRQSVVLRIDPSRASGSDQAPKPLRARNAYVLSEGWSVREHSLPAEPPAIGSWSNTAGLEHASGTVRYSCAFEWDTDVLPERLVLDLGEAYEIAEVKVNGKEAGVVMWSPYRFDVTPFVIKGENVLEVTVTNSLANRIDRLQLPSGLIGPVTLTAFE